MKKILLINGSFRKVNCNFILEEIKKGINESFETEILHIKDYNLKFCTGCFNCYNSGKCIFQDGMESILEKIKNCDLMVIATPNYFGNVNALTKNFIDRTSPFYINKNISDKKCVMIYVGEYKVERTLKQLSLAMDGFRFSQRLKVVKEMSFQTNGNKMFAETELAEFNLKRLIKIINENA